MLKSKDKQKQKQKVSGKLCALRAHVLHALRAYMFAWQRGLSVFMLTCQLVLRA